MDEQEWEDFSNVSEWEELQHRVEQVLVHWGLRGKGTVTHMDDDDDDDVDDDDDDKTFQKIKRNEKNDDNDDDDDDETRASGSMDGIQGGTLKWRSQEIAMPGNTHQGLQSATYRLTLYYGNTASGLPRWSKGQQHLTPTMLSLLDTRQDFQLGRPFVHRIFGLSHFLILSDINDDVTR